MDRPSEYQGKKASLWGPNSNIGAVETKGSNDAIQEMHNLAVKLNLEMAFAQYPPTQRLSEVYPEALKTISQANSPVKISTLEFVEEDQGTIQVVISPVDSGAGKMRTQPMNMQENLSTHKQVSLSKDAPKSITVPSSLENKTNSTLEVDGGGKLVLLLEESHKTDSCLGDGDESMRMKLLEIRQTNTALVNKSNQL